MNTTDLYVKIRKALEMRPTPGPWTYDRRDGTDMEELPKITTVAYCCDYVIGLPSRYPGGDYRYDPSGSPEADTAFIAACDPDTIRELLAERDALAAEVERVRDGNRYAHLEQIAINRAEKAEAALAERDKEIEELRDALEHVTELLVDTWNTKMEGDPERQVAVRDARAALRGKNDE